MIKISKGDITESDCEAIVNAANNELKLGSGVAGAIREKGGSSVQEECDRIGAIKVGEAALTGAGNLKAKYVIHAASMGFSQPATAESLQASVKASLQICVEKQIKSIAFPALGTGVSGFPMPECAEIMLRVARQHQAQNEYPVKYEFVLWDEQSLKIFKSALYQQAQ